MITKRTLIISSRSQWEISLSDLENCLIENNIDTLIQQSIYVSFDEVISNIFNNNSSINSLEVLLNIEIEPSIITLTFKDNGKIFNPLNNIKENKNSIGGWGIDIIKKLMDEINYEIIDGENFLTIKKHLL